MPLPASAKPPLATDPAGRESEARFRATFDHAALGIAHIGLDGQMLHVNPRLCRMHGYPREELLRMQAGELVVDGGAGSQADLQRLLGGEVHSYTAVRHFRRKSGEVYPGRVSVSLVREPHAPPYLLSFVEDLTERAETERRLREQSLMLDQVNDAIVVHDVGSRRIRYWNLGAQRLFGWTPQQAAGRTFDQLLGPAASIGAEGRAALLRDGHRVAQMECRAADGRPLWVERRLSVLRDEDGTPLAVLSVNTDITEQRRAREALEALNAQLELRIRERTEQLVASNEELRLFAHALAHDIRGPLASIGGFAGELERRLAGQLDEPAQHGLRRIRAGVQMMAQLTQAMSSLVRLSEAPLLREPVDLSALARQCAQRLREQHPQRQVALHIAATPPAEGDARLLTALLDNLLGNAWKFTGRRADAEVRFDAHTEASGRVVYRVADNGAGFDQAHAGQLFAPFERLHTSAEFEGSGIGLAMVRKIAGRHGGQVWAEAAPDQGARFFFTLGEPA